MDNKTLALRAACYANIPTVYAKGCWGQEITKSLIASKKKQYPEWYTDEKIRKYFEPLYENGVKGFDCVCFIKALCFWQDGYKSKYDWTTSKMISHCTESKGIPAVGEILWNDSKSHVGIYVGDGMCAECNTSPSRDVHVTPVALSQFTHHGFADWIEYTAV